MTELASIGDLCHVMGGATPSKKNAAYYDGEIPWATVRDMGEEVLAETEFKITKEALASCSSSLVPSGNVIIATRVGLGKVCLLAQDTAINQDLRGLVPKDPARLDRKYLFYSMKALASRIVAAGTGATVQGVRLPFVKKLQIQLPSLGEQQRIVSKLDESFVNLRRLEGINADKRAEIGNLGKSVFQAVLDANPNWPMRPLHEVVTRVTVGFVGPMVKEYKTEGVPFLRSTNIKPFHLDLGDIRFIDEAFNAKIQKSILTPGDVAVVRTGAPGIAAVIPPELPMANCSDLVIVRPSDQLNASFLTHVLNSNWGIRAVAGDLVGAAQQHFNVGAAKRMIVPVPPISEQQEVVERLEAIRSETEQLSKIERRRSEFTARLFPAMLTASLRGH